MTHKQNIIEIGHLSLTQDDFDQKIDHLIALAENERKNNLVVDVFIIEYHYKFSGEYESYTDYFLQDIYKKKLRFRYLTDLVRNSKTPWIFVGKGHCWELSWELAYCCHAIIWLDRSSYIGFHFQRYSSVSSGGFIDQLARQAQSIKNKWPEQNYMHVEQGNLHGFIKDILIVEPVNEKTYFLRWLNSVLKNLPKQTRKNGEIDWEEVFTHNTNFKTFKTIPWEWDKYLWNESRFDKNFKNYSEKIRYLAFKDAKELIERFQNPPIWKLQDNPNSTHPLKDRTIYIEIDGYFPPVSIVLTLVKNNFNIVFFHAENQHLMKNLKQIYAAYEKRMTKSLLEKIWEKNIFWTVQSEKSPQRSYLKFFRNDCCEITLGENTFHLQRIKGNRIKAERGPAELLDNDEKKLEIMKCANSQLLIDSLCSELYSSGKIMDQRFPLSIIIRSYFLEHIAKYSSYQDTSLSSVFAELKNSGWKEGCSKHFWLHFLEERCQYTSGLSEKRCHEFGINYAFWTKKSLNDFFNKTSVDTNHSFLPLRLSEYLEINLACLAKKILKDNLMTDSLEINSLFKEALGYPDNSILPLDKLRHFGVRRAINYFQKYQPNMRGYI